MNRRSLKIATGLATTVMALCGTGYLGAQIGRDVIQANYYRVKVVNELGEPVRVGMIGYDRDANLRVDLRTGGSWTGNLYAGQRVVVAWDRNRNLVHAAEVEIDRSGTLRLQSMQPMLAPQSREPRLRAQERPSPLPRMTIEP